MTIKTKKQLTVYMMLRILILFIAVLLPFAIRSEQFYFVGAYSGPSISCQSESMISTVNQCITWETSTWSRTIIVLIGAIGLAITSFMPLRHRKAVWIKTELAISGIALSVLGVLYWLMLKNSQSMGFGSADELTNGEWVVNNPPTFGIGISGIAVLLLFLLFCLQPAIYIYTNYVSKKHISGLNKSDLFQ